MFEKFCIICYRKTKIEGDKMKNKYTKGFWKVCKKTCCIVAQRQAGEFVVALCRSATPDKLINEEIQANERLITASPELLEACKLAINNFIMARKQVGAYNTLNENEKLAYELEQEAFIAMEKAVAKAEDK
jgi:hypothetical protein